MESVRKNSAMKKNQSLQIIGYLAIAFGLPLVCILLCELPLICENGVLSFLLFGIEGATPTIAAVIMVMIYNGKSGLKKYIMDKYRCNLSLKNCIYGFSVPLILLTGAKIVSVLFGDTTPFITPVTVRKIIIIAWALIAEELGWRGFLQDKLEILPDKYIPPVIGIIWALWHYHFIVSGSMEVPVVAFTLGCVFESFGYFALTKFAKNNIVPASIWHFTGNMMFNLYRFDPQWHNGEVTFYWIATIFYAANMILFVAYVRRKNITHTTGER